MTPKEKAQELVDRIQIEISWELADGYNSTEIFKAAKKSALISVINILSVLDGFAWTPTKDYWQEVKQEIEKL